MTTLLIKQYCLGLSKIAGYRWKSAPTWLVSYGYSTWHFFVDGYLLWQLSRLLQNLLTTLLFQQAKHKNYHEFIPLSSGFIIGRCGGWTVRLDKARRPEAAPGGSWGGVDPGCGSGIVGGWACRPWSPWSPCWWSCCCCWPKKEISE